MTKWGVVCVLLLLALGWLAGDAAGQSERLITQGRGLRHLPRDGRPPRENEKQLLVISGGGVGTSSLMDTLEEALKEASLVPNSRGDKDGLKHITFPEAKSRVLDSPKLAALVFVYDAPENAVMSLIRRNFASLQVYKLRRGMSQAEKTELKHWKARGVFKDAESYLKAGKDMLGLENHFRKWVEGLCANLPAYPVVLLRRSALNRHVDAFAQALGLSVATIRSAPAFQQKERTSDSYFDEHPEILQALSDLYQPLKHLYASVGDFAVLDSSSCSHILRKFKLSEIEGKLEHKE